MKFEAPVRALQNIRLRSSFAFITYAKIAMLWTLLIVLPNAHATPSSVSAQEVEHRLEVIDRSDKAINAYFAHFTPELKTRYPGLLQTLRDTATTAPDQITFALAMTRFVAALGNTHTWFYDPLLWEEGKPGLGLNIDTIEGQWVVITSERPNLEAGDIITHIDAEPFEQFYTRQRSLINASSERGARSSLSTMPFLFPPVFHLSLTDGRSVRVDRFNKPRTPQTSIRGEQSKVVEARWIIDGTTALLRVKRFDSRHHEAILDALNQLRSATALIIDVRGNGGGDSPTSLLAELIDGDFPWWKENPNNLRSFFSMFARRSGTGSFKGKLWVLIDRRCGSACEDFVMPLKVTGRATLVGENTFGSTGQPYSLDLGSGRHLVIGARRSWFPDGAAFEGIGIAPDVFIDRSIDALVRGEDPVLETTLELARQSVR